MFNIITSIKSVFCKFRFGGKGRGLQLSSSLPTLVTHLSSTISNRCGTPFQKTSIFRQTSLHKLINNLQILQYTTFHLVTPIIQGLLMNLYMHNAHKLKSARNKEQTHIEQDTGHQAACFKPSTRRNRSRTQRMLLDDDRMQTTNSVLYIIMS